MNGTCKIQGNSLLTPLPVDIKDATQEKPDGREAQGNVWMKGHRAPVLTLGASPSQRVHVLSSLGPLKPVPWGLLWGRHHIGMVDYPLHCELLSLETERWG